MYLIEISFRSEQFGKQNSSARRSAQCVVRKADKLIIEHAVFSESARANRHTEFDVSVEFGLRSVVFGKVVYKLSRSGGEEQRLRFARELRPSF